MRGTTEPEPLFADGDSELLGTDQKGRTQRQTMALKNVRYRLSAEVRPWPGQEGKLTALEAQFRRRADRGKCFYQPSFGCREFAAFFKMVAVGQGSPPLREPEGIDIDIGLMLYDVFDLSRPGSSSDRPQVSLFRAHVCQGVLDVPDYFSHDVIKAT
jgi:CRISPR-associated protein Cas5d